MSALFFLRWALTAILLGVAAIYVAMNAVWARAAQNASKDCRAPSLVPLVAPILTIVATIVAPRAIIAIAIPIVLALDVGTKRVLLALLRRKTTQK